MRKLLLLLTLVVSLAGCNATPAPIDPLDNVTYGDLLNTESLMDQHYWQNAQVEGIIWQPHRSVPGSAIYDRYGRGGDSALFTGFVTAAYSFKYGVTGSDEDFEKIRASVRGLHILTHVTGTPGVIARCAFPTARAEEWGFPDWWGSRLDGGFVDTRSGVADPFNPGSNYPEMTYYTRATKDQLTGLVCGLAVAWKILENPAPAHATEAAALRQIVATIAHDVFTHLEQNDFRIVNEHGTNDTSADDVDNRLKLALLAVYRQTVGLTDPTRQAEIEGFYQDQLGVYNAPWTWDGLVYRFNNWEQYFAWNLRYTRSFTVWILESAEGRQVPANYVETWLWPGTRDHYNAYFTFIHQIMVGNGDRLPQGITALKSASLRPIVQTQSPALGAEIPNLFEAIFGLDTQYVLAPALRKSTSYWTWQKEPWDTGHEVEQPIEDDTGLSFLLPYWMGRYYGFIPAN